MAKTPRFFRDIIISEKIDGTNACVEISFADSLLTGFIATSGVYGIRAASRTRWITPQDDNFGFANWVVDNRDELVKLGEGRHFGEWWGRGINRNYDLAIRQFSLFNLSRWYEKQEELPSCVSLVPLLYCGPFEMREVRHCLDTLAVEGSHVKPGFMTPEGICIFHSASRQVYKVTLEHDDKPKSAP